MMWFLPRLLAFFIIFNCKILGDTIGNDNNEESNKLRSNYVSSIYF